MKTAIAELFERYGHLLPDVEKEFLEKEKQQIIRAHCAGQDIEDTAGIPDALEYIGKTFKND